MIHSSPAFVNDFILKCTTFRPTLLHSSHSFKDNLHSSHSFKVCVHSTHSFKDCVNSRHGFKVCVHSTHSFKDYVHSSHSFEDFVHSSYSFEDCVHSSHSFENCTFTKLNVWSNPLLISPRLLSIKILIIAFNIHEFIVWTKLPRYSFIFIWRVNTEIWTAHWFLLGRAKHRL